MNASCGTDPLIHYGRHFGRTVHALCTVSSILNNGILRMGELQDQPEETFTLESVFVLFILIDIMLINQSVMRERREHRIFKQLLMMIPGLEERLLDGSDETIMHIGELVSRIRIHKNFWT
jgi:hypothetical protein